MSKFIRILVSALAGLAGAIIVLPGVAQASLGADVEYTLTVPAASLTVGDTDIAVALTVSNANTGSQSILTNTVCNSNTQSPPCSPPGTGTPVDDRGINLVPSCGAFGPAPVTCVTPDPGVFAADAVGSGAAGSACDGRNFDIVASDPVYGTLRFTPQGATPLTLAGGETCVIEFEVDVVGYPTVDQSPTLPGRQTGQIADVSMFNAANDLTAYDSDSSNITINPATPTLETQASTTVPLGATISDTAFVSGRVFPDPTANVHFDLYGPNDPTCAGGAIFTSDVPITSTESSVTSAAFSPTAIGTYNWVARYDGDSNNAAVQALCGADNESVVVTQAAPELVTNASDDIRLGGTITDTATVSGRVGAIAGGTIDFRLYGPDDETCAGTPAFESLGLAISTTSDVVTSAPFTPVVPGTYRWVAEYSGDANNIGDVGACNDANESVVVGLAQPEITTDAGDDIAVGGSLSDKATITGRVSPSASTVDFRLYGPDDDTCSGAPVFEALGVDLPVGDTMVTSPSFTTTAPGTYRWIAAYSGDANNEPAVGECGDPDETVDVLQGNPEITTQASPGIRVGAGVVFDEATVTGLVLPQPGATIDFRLYGPGDTTCSGVPVFESRVAYPVAGGTVRSASFTPTTAGTYRWVATYSGDANNSSATGTCGDPAELVEVVLNPEVELPATGSETDMLLRTGGGLLAVGLALVGLGGRRRRPSLRS